MIEERSASSDAPHRRTRRRRSLGRQGKGSAKARRKAARLAAVQALYQIDLTGADTEAVLGEFVRHRIGHELDGDRYVEADKPLFADIVRGARARRKHIESIVSGTLDPEYPLERRETIVQVLLCAGTFELLAHTDVAPRIVITEYVDIAHAFFSGREPALINGVLDRVARALRPEEMEDRQDNRGDSHIATRNGAFAETSEQADSPATDDTERDDAERDDAERDDAECDDGGA